MRADAANKAATVFEQPANAAESGVGMRAFLADKPHLFGSGSGASNRRSGGCRRALGNRCRAVRGAGKEARKDGEAERDPKFEVSHSAGQDPMRCAAMTSSLRVL